MEAERIIYMACDITGSAADCCYCRYRSGVAERLRAGKGPERNPHFKIGRDLAVISFKTAATMGEFLLEYGEACLSRSTASELLRLLREKRQAEAATLAAQEEEDRLDEERRIREERALQEA